MSPAAMYSLASRTAGVIAGLVGEHWPAPGRRRREPGGRGGRSSSMRVEHGLGRGVRRAAPGLDVRDEHQALATWSKATSER